ncbi:Unknown protein [Striga hermonthica]|uniref:Uncharacterized protein n=1 Tax=Striga hermonthica TaxID=68872 RepID=A0A9N7RET6_STRHE|nr:Unknown protein [Striga hermonthica]
MAGTVLENDATFAKNLTKNVPSNPSDDTDTNIKKKKKKSGAFGIFRAALLMMRKQSGPRKPALKNTDFVMKDKDNVTLPTNNINSTNNSWTQFVGSVRPLHLQETTQVPPLKEEKNDEAVEVESVAGSSSSRAMSQYASASSLVDLDESSDDEDEDPDEVFDALTGDEMIDAKAEEFIAQFYKQIQLQKTTARAHHYHHHYHHHRHHSMGI